MTRTLNRIGLALILPAILLALWQYQATRGGANAYAFAPLGDIARSLVTMTADGTLLFHAAASLQRAVSALLIGGGLGVVVGCAMGVWRPFEFTAAPLINALRQVPILGWLPLVALWFGNGDDAKLLLVSTATFYPTVLNTQQGMHAVDRKLSEVGELYGFSPWQALRLITWPSALPLVLTGISQALAFSWIATIGVELLFSATAGLGTEMMAAQVAARTDIVIVCIACVAVMGFALNRLFAVVRTRALRWQPPSR
jgi:sulfonate transport system permease protein